MARAKASESQRSRSKPNAVEELTRGITTLRELSTQIDDLGRDGCPYREAVRARTELSFRETIRRLFGEKSPEYQAHKNHKLRIGTRAESAQSTTLVKELILVLEQQKAELLGVEPAAPTTPSPTPTAPEHPTLKAVPPSRSAEPLTPPSAHSPTPLAAVTMPGTPVTVSVAMTTNLSPPTQTQAPVVMTTPVTMTTTPIPTTPATAPQPIRDSSIQRGAPSPPLPSSTPGAAVVPAAPPAAALVSTTPLGPTESTAPSPLPKTTVPLEQTARRVEPPVSAAPLTPVRSPVPSGTIPPIPRMSPASVSMPTDPIAPPSPLEQLFKPTDSPDSKPAPVTRTPSTPSASLTEVAQVKNPGDTLPITPDLPSRPALIDTPSPAAPNPITKPERAVAVASQSPSPPPLLVAPLQASMEGHRSAAATLDTLRRMCARFHLVARQLRLRKEYRPTLEITDEYDLQDLFYALLRLQFDEVGTEEWAPAYTNGERRTSYLLDWDHTVVVVKQTRSGLTTRDIAEQIAADKAHFSSRPNGTSLVCFIYDPDGRVGNPRGLEADLSTISDTYKVEVIVAPK
ncbi:MAG: hypothetical protein H8K05_00925 [Nitrospira sp.]|nr:hypothetical protein [Nitrospira sp.]